MSDFNTAPIGNGDQHITTTPNTAFQAGSLYHTFQPPAQPRQDGFFGPHGSWVWGDGAYLTPPLTEAEKKSVRDEYLKSLLAQIAHLEEEVTRIRQDKARDVAEALGELRIVMDELDES